MCVCICVHVSAWLMCVCTCVIMCACLHMHACICVCVCVCVCLCVLNSLINLSLCVGPVESCFNSDFSWGSPHIIMLLFAEQWLLLLKQWYGRTMRVLWALWEVFACVVSWLVLLSVKCPLSQRFLSDCLQRSTVSTSTSVPARWCFCFLLTGLTMEIQVNHKD